MGEVRVRQAAAGDALIVAALRLQAARALGAGPEPGFLDRFARVWDAESDPTWVAELDGSHAGVLIARSVPPLPWPGVAAYEGGHLLVSTLFVAPAHADRDVAQALTAAMTTWASERGLALTGDP